MPQPTIIQVALPLPIPQTFDYFNKDNNDKIKLGSRVLVPFGARKIIGIVSSSNNFSDVDHNKIKPIILVLDTKPTLDNEIFKLCQFVSKYYQASIGEALSLAVPNILRKNHQPQNLRINYIWRACGDIASLKNANRQSGLWHFINSFEFGVENSELNRSFNGWHSFAKALLKKNLLIRATKTDAHPTDQAKTLNPEQTEVVNNIKLAQFKVHLLYGITGSGKTEVYLQIIEPVIKNNQQVLILVPEISLTPQTSQQFKSRFNTNIASQHSKLNDNERRQIWSDCQSGVVQILIGTRSAIFNQFSNLALIIVDEEHDLSFKQQDKIRYSARDLAIVRAKYNNIPIILGSATPALESIFNAKIGNYQLHKLTQRAGNARPPKIKIVDVGLKNPPLSKYSLSQITTTLQQGLQVMIFINRRGFSPALYCVDCCASVQCPNCQANLTVHKTPPKMICHHCAYTQNIIKVCSKCNSGQLLMLGAGTEKIEQQLKLLFPETGVVRIDRDTTSKKLAWYDLYQKINSTETGILIGTQMLAKGHHFPKVALVVVVGIDYALLSADFRATEHLAQLIVQVCGRSGRAEYQGAAILQTRYPQHPLLNKLLANGYLSVCNDLLNERKISQLPPFTAMCLLRSESVNTDNARQLLITIKKTINNPNIEVLGPIPAPMEKLAGKFRFQLLLQAKTKSQLQRFLVAWLPIMRTIKPIKSVRLNIDVDPISMT